MMRRERLSSRFPHRVWSVATTDATGSIGFDATGELLLLDGERFNANYIGQSVFLRCKLPSFIAQLYGHGWRKSHEDIAEGLPNGRSPHFLRAFRHPSFHRNQPELLGEIRASFNDKKLKRQKIEGNIRRTSVDAIYNTELSDGSDDNNNLSDEAISTSEPRPKRKIRHVPTQVSNSYSSAAHPSKSSPNVPVDGSTKEKPCGIVGEMVVSSAPAKYQVAVRQRSQTVAETIASSRAAAKRQIFVKHTSSQSDFGVPIESWEVEPAGCDSFELIWPNLSPT